MNEDQRDREKRAIDIGEIGIKSSEVEELLKSKFNAQGEGLGQQFRSVKHLLPPALCNELRRIVPIRNRAIHEASTFRMPHGFLQDFDRAKMMLEQLEPQAGGYAQDNSHGRSVDTNQQSYRQGDSYDQIRSLSNQVMIDALSAVGEYIGTKLPQNRSMPSSALSYIISGCKMIFKFFFQYMFFVTLALVYVFTLLQILIGNFFGGDFKFLIICLVTFYALASMLTVKLYQIDRSAQNRGKIRLPASFLHALELLGGWPVLLISQQVFRRNDRSKKYQFVFNTILIFHISLIINIFLFHGLLWWVNLPILFLVFMATLIDLVQPE